MQFDFTLGANQSQMLDVKGRFFKCVTATGKVRVRTNTGESIDLMPGQGVWNVDFQWLSVQDRTGANNNGTIIAGAFDFHDDRIAGTVDMVDGGRTRTNAGQALTAHLYSGANAAGISSVQLWNPASSGKNVIVNQIQGGIGGGYALQMKPTSATLLSLDATATSGNIGSKKAGGAAGVAVGYQSNALAASPVVGATFAVSNGVVLRLSEPILLPPGWGLTFASPVVNNAVGADIEYFEESVT